jgi:hypothetical protein
MWLKKFKIEMTEPKKEIVKVYNQRLKRRDRSVISNQVMIHKLGTEKKIRKLQLKNDLLTSGACALTKIRTGAYQFINKILDKKHFNKCIFCNKNIEKNPEHLFIYCNA